MTFMSDIAVMGSFDSIYGFGALGLSLYPAETQAEAKKIFKQLKDSDTAIIYITEEIASFLEDAIEKSASAFLPAVILIPGAKGNTGKGIEIVRSSVIRAVGSDILS